MCRYEILFKGGHKGVVEIVVLAKNFSWEWFVANAQRDGSFISDGMVYKTFGLDL